MRTNHRTVAVACLLACGVVATDAGGQEVPRGRPVELPKAVETTPSPVKTRLPQLLRHLALHSRVPLPFDDRKGDLGNLLAPGSNDAQTVHADELARGPADAGRLSPTGVVLHLLTSSSPRTGLLRAETLIPLRC